MFHPCFISLLFFLITNGCLQPTRSALSPRFLERQKVNAMNSNLFLAEVENVFQWRTAPRQKFTIFVVLFSSRLHIYKEDEMKFGELLFQGVLESLTFRETVFTLEYTELGRLLVRNSTNTLSWRGA
jgi:hypothetical protein